MGLASLKELGKWNLQELYKAEWLRIVNESRKCYLYKN